MTAVDWEEVKRLAADFQRAQLSSTSQTLSERNCIEIIKKLIELSLLDVIFTTDGKEYITPQYLVKEIKDELYISGGRINLVELAHNLNVDFSHISVKAAEVERSSPGCCIILGQLIDKQYINYMCVEINENLKEKGQVTISELTRTFDLPSDFIQGVVEKNLGKSIFAKQDKSDSRVFFTEAFVEHNKCLVRGALTALTKPTQVSSILQLCQIQERDFYMAFESLLEGRQISGVLTGKQGPNSLFIPSVFTKQQNEWVDNFYQQNGYLEYDSLTRLGISEPLSFVRRHFAGKGLVELATCAVGSLLISQAHSAVEEALVSGSYIDLTMMLPSILSEEDVGKVLEIALKKCKSKTAVNVFCKTVVMTSKFLEELSSPFYNGGMVKSKAEEAVSSGAYLQAQVDKKMKSLGKEEQHEDHKLERREERRKKAAGGKGGGGTQGRETKTKSIKKKPDRRGRGDDNSDEEMEIKKKVGDGVLELISIAEVEKVLNEGPLGDESEDLITEVSLHLQPSLNKAAMEAAKEAFERLSGGTRRKLHADIQELVDSLLIEIRLAEKGAKLIGGETGSKLLTHLVKTLCSDLSTAVINYVCGVGGETSGEKSKLLLDLPSDTREPLSKLSKAANIEDFFSNLETALAASGLVLRKQDKKKEKSWLLEQREVLSERLRTTEDSALALHLSVLIIFQSIFNSYLHASGKFVPLLLTFLKSHISAQEFEVLHNFQELVLKLLKTGEEEVLNHLKAQLEEHLESIKDLAINYKKHTNEKS